MIRKEVFCGECECLHYDTCIFESGNLTCKVKLQEVIIIKNSICISYFFSHPLCREIGINSVEIMGSSYLDEGNNE